MAGLATGVVIYLVAFGAIGVIASAAGRERSIDDRAVLDAAGDLARLGDERLAAAADGRALPRPPQFAGDVVTARIAYALGALASASIAGAALLAMRNRPRAIAGALRLDRSPRDDLWKAPAVALAATLAVVVYAAGARAAGIDILVPQGQVPGAVVRDNVALGLFAVVALLLAPLTEEFFFRGLVFGGLARWGVIPALVVSGLGFALSHASTGTIIPFTFVGVSFAWLYWSTGNLWNAVAAHFLFNLTSFAMLLGQR